MSDYRVRDKDGDLWSQWDSEAEAVADAQNATKNHPAFAPFTVQRCEWIDVPLPEPLPPDLPTEVWTCDAWRKDSGYWGMDPPPPLRGEGRRFRGRIVDWEEVPE